MFDPECLKDLNFLMNHLNKVGYQYKSNACDFKDNGESGIAIFLNWEEAERYEYSDKVQEYIAVNDGQTIYVMIPEPMHKGATIATLNDLIELEKQTVMIIDSFIMSASDRSSEITKAFLIQMRHMCQHQYNEVKCIVADMAKIINDPGAMNSYNIFLIDKFGMEKY